MVYACYIDTDDDFVDCDDNNDDDYDDNSDNDGEF